MHHIGFSEGGGNGGAFINLPERQQISANIRKMNYLHPNTFNLNQSLTRHRPGGVDSAGGSADGSAARENMVAANIKIRQAGMMRNGIEQSRIQGLWKAAD